MTLIPQGHVKIKKHIPAQQTEIGKMNIEIKKHNKIIAAPYLRQNLIDLRIMPFCRALFIQQPGKLKTTYA